MHMDKSRHFLILDTSTIVNGLIGCPDKQTEIAAKTIMRLIENKEFTKIDAYITPKIEKEF